MPFSYNSKEYLEKTYFNKPTFAFKDFSTTEKGAILEVYLGDYYDFLDTCMLFQYETAYEYKYLNLKKPSKKGLRNNFDLLNTENRFVALGVSALTIIKNITAEDGSVCTKFLLHERIGNVAASVNQFHVVPSGSHQPLYDSIEQCIIKGTENLMLTIKREFIEEIFGHEETENTSSIEMLNELIVKYNLDNVLKDTYLLSVGFHPLDTHIDVFAITIINAIGSSIGTTEKEIISKIKGKNEGEVTLQNFNKGTIKNYAEHHKATVSLKSNFQFIYDNYDDIINQLNIYEVTTRPTTKNTTKNKKKRNTHKS